MDAIPVTVTVTCEAVVYPACTCGRIYTMHPSAECLFYTPSRPVTLHVADTVRLVEEHD